MLIDSWNTDSSDLAPEDQAAIQWFEARLEQLTSDVDKAISEFRLSEALMELYKATWTDFCHGIWNLLSEQRRILSNRSKRKEH